MTLAKRIVALGAGMATLHLTAINGSLSMRAFKTYEENSQRFPRVLGFKESLELK